MFDFQRRSPRKEQTDMSRYCCCISDGIEPSAVLLISGLAAAFSFSSARLMMLPLPLLLLSLLLYLFLIPGAIVLRLRQDRPERAKGRICCN